MFQAHVLIIRKSELHYTASGIIISIGGRLLSQPVHQTATYRCDDTRRCVMQFWPPDDEHMCSKHVEAWNKLIVKQKFCASSWLITEINIRRGTVSKTSKSEFMHDQKNKIFQRTIYQRFKPSKNVIFIITVLFKWHSTPYTGLYIRHLFYSFKFYKTIFFLSVLLNETIKCNII